MREIYDHWERLSAVINYAEMSPNYFARHIGLPCGENIYRIKRGQNGISRDVADRIVEKFPCISKGWLMTGEGRMFLGDDSETPQIPYYDKDALKVLDGAVVPPVCYLSLPMIGDCDMAITFGGEEENSEKKILLLAKTSREKLKEGNEYLFLFKKMLSLQIWSPEMDAVLGDEDLIFAIKGELYLNEELKANM